MRERDAPLRLVLIANRHERNDGQGRVNYEVALAALNFGMHVTLLTAYCADEIINHSNAQVVWIGKEDRPTQLWKNLAFARESAKWLRAHRTEFDLVQANGFITWEPCDIVTAHFVHGSWARSPHFPFTRSLRPEALYQRVFTALNARWERSAFRSTQHVIAVSEIVAGEVEAVGIAKNKIRVIHNGVDTDEFQPGPSTRELFSLPTGIAIALFVGDIRSPRKNIRTVLRALAQVPGLHLAVAGEVSRSAAPALAKEYAVFDRVHFLGKVANIPALMRSVDLFVFPSLYEPFGLVALEAAASGLPGILSPQVGAASVLRGAVEMVDDPENPGELADTIRELIERPERREELGRMARERALSLQWSRAAQAYLRTYIEMTKVRGNQ